MEMEMQRIACLGAGSREFPQSGGSLIISRVFYYGNYGNYVNYGNYGDNNITKYPVNSGIRGAFESKTMDTLSSTRIILGVGFLLRILRRKKK